MKQAAEKLGISYDALRAYIYRFPELRPCITIGRNSMWTADEIDAVRQKRKNTAPAEQSE